MKVSKFSLVAAACFVIVIGLGCGGSKSVDRIAPETTTDLSGEWNDTDSRLVSEEMIRDCLSSSWLPKFSAAHADKPVVTVGTIRNRSSDRIDPETFTSDFERELLNSSLVRFVASRKQRSEIREERSDQKGHASVETAKRMAQEVGADFLLVGSVKSIVDQEKGTKVKFYQTDLELIDIESNEKVWIGSKKIKKIISRKKVKF